MGHNRSRPYTRKGAPNMGDRALRELEDAMRRREAEEGEACPVCGARAEWGHAMHCPRAPRRPVDAS